MNIATIAEGWLIFRLLGEDRSIGSITTTDEVARNRCDRWSTENSCIILRQTVNVHRRPAERAGFVGWCVS